jgi:hypothetical protein
VKLEENMPDQPMQNGFTETHHALLFGLMAKAIMEQAGEHQGEAVLRKAVQQYGHERGRRMALRANANRHPLNMANYIAYSEWKSSPGNQHEMQMVEKAPDARVHIHKCPWYQAWKENDLIPYARFYCLEVDRALAHGFNPDLQLDVNGTLPNGAEACEFVYHGANLTPMNYLLLAYKKSVKPGKSAVMPWDYHVGHLYKTVERVVFDELGEPGRMAVQAGLAEFTRRYGEQAALSILAYRSVDFDRLP